MLYPLHGSLIKCYWSLFQRFCMKNTMETLIDEKVSIRFSWQERPILDSCEGSSIVDERLKLRSMIHYFMILYTGVSAYGFIKSGLRFSPLRSTPYWVNSTKGTLCELLGTGGSQGIELVITFVVSLWKINWLSENLNLVRFKYVPVKIFL